MIDVKIKVAVFILMLSVPFPISRTIKRDKKTNRMTKICKVDNPHGIRTIFPQKALPKIFCKTESAIDIRGFSFHFTARSCR